MIFGTRSNYMMKYQKAKAKLVEYNTPSEESIKAAKTALSGSNYVGESLYFLNPTIASSNWIVKNRDFYTTIANHDFYV